MSLSIQSQKMEEEKIITVNVNYQKLNNRTNRFENKTRIMTFSKK